MGLHCVAVLVLSLEAGDTLMSLVKQTCCCKEWPSSDLLTVGTILPLFQGRFQKDAVPAQNFHFLQYLQWPDSTLFNDIKFDIAACVVPRGRSA